MSEIRIQEVQEKAPLMDKLVELWAASVRATHHFLSDTEVNQIKEYVPQAVGFYEHMGFEAYKRTDLDEEGNPYPLLYMKRVQEILAQL